MGKLYSVVLWSFSEDNRRVPIIISVFANNEDDARSLLIAACKDLAQKVDFGDVFMALLMRISARGAEGGAETPPALRSDTACETSPCPTGTMQPQQSTAVSFVFSTCMSEALSPEFLGPVVCHYKSSVASRSSATVARAQ